MDKEYKSLMQNYTWVVVPKPYDVKIVRCMWLYKLKKGFEKLEPTKYTVRLVT